MEKKELPLVNMKEQSWSDIKPSPKESYKRFETLSSYQRLVVKRFFLKGEFIKDIAKETNKSTAFVNHSIRKVKEKLGLAIICRSQLGQKELFTRQIKSMLELRKEHIEELNNHEKTN